MARITQLEEAEVLRRQPEVVQTFLLQTAILERLCGPLCDAVTAQQTGQAMLEYLEQANLFLVPLDDERNWYRSHHLFSELLRHRLRRSSPEQVPELHRRAAGWYEQQGLLAEAVGHALAAPEYPQAVRLMEQAELALQHLPQDEATTRMLSEIDSLWADLACNRGELPRAIALCHRALERIPRDHVFLRGTIFLTLGNSYGYNGELAATERALTEALELSQGAGNLYGVMDALYLLAWKHTLSGHLHLAYRTDERALPLVQSHPEYRRSPRISMIYMLMGEILREWNALDEAAQAVSQGIEHGQQSGFEKALSVGAIFLARVRQAQGRSEEAARLMQQYEQSVHQDSATTLAGGSIFLYLVRLWILQGNLDAPIPWGQYYRRTLVSDGSPRALYAFEWLTLARLLLAQSRQGRDLPTCVCGMSWEPSIRMSRLPICFPTVDNWQKLHGVCCWFA